MICLDAASSTTTPDKGKKRKCLELCNTNSEVQQEAYGIMSISKRKREDRGPSKGMRTPRSAKKKKGTGLDQDSFFSNKDVLSYIVAFLDVKSLYKFTMTSKTCFEMLRPNQVVRAALYRGGHSKTNIERIMDLVRKKKILVPSPIRMLRICIGRTCERCQTKRVNFVSKHFGVFFCKDCLENGGYVKMLRRYDSSFYPHVSHLYVIPEGSHGLRVWAKPYYKNDGTRCGPPLSMQCRLKGGESHKQAMADLRQEDAQQRKKCLPLMEKAYREHLDSANERVLTNRVAKYLASLAAQEKRNQRIRETISALGKALGDAPWKSLLLSHEWVHLGSRDQVVFSAPLARELLEGSMSAPSKITRTRLFQLANSLRRCIGVFEESHLHDFLYFTYDPLFMNRCLASFPNYGLLTCSWVNVENIKLLHRLNHHDRIIAVSQLLVQQLTVEADQRSDED